jgi:hypothetical protein
LEATDLIEVSTIESGSYVTRSITGQELIDAIPLPPSGLTVGTTPIASGTIGRVLFQGTGNVLQQSSSLFWDNTNGYLGIGTSSPTTPLYVNGATTINNRFLYHQGNSAIQYYMTANAWSGTNTIFFGDDSSSIIGSISYNHQFDSLAFNVNAAERMRIFSTGNIGINTTTDAGFRLDVNGTARVQSKLTIGNSTASPYQLNVWGGAIESYISLNNTNSGALNTDGFQIGLEANGTDVYFINRENGFIQFRTNGLDRFRVANTGNVLINTTTDAGFRLDVNGTARFQNEFIINRSDGIEMFRMFNSAAVLAFNANNSSTPTFRLHSQAGVLFYLKASENRIGINTISPNASAILDVASTTQGFLPPRMTTTQKNAIASPATGLQVFDTTLNQMSYYNGTTWTNI